MYIEPTSQEIFERSLSERYGIVRVPSGTLERQVSSVLSRSPTANPADGFIFGCMRCVVVTDGYAIVGDRYWDLAVAAFSSRESRERFRNGTRSWRLMTAVDVARRIERQTRDRSDFVAALRTNYQGVAPLSRTSADEAS
jgi:hypothetical protein